VPSAVLITLKDLRQRARDRSVFIWGVVAPLGLAAIFSLLLGGLSDPDDISVSLGVVDHDGGEVARALVDGVLGGVGADSSIEVAESGDEEELRAEVATGDLDALIVIPEGFTAAVTAGSPVTLEVVGSRESPIGVQVARAITDGFAAEVNAVAVAVATDVALRGGDTSGTAAAARAAQAVSSPLALGDLPATDKRLSAETFYSAAMAVFFLFFTVQFGVTGLLEEKQNGTMSRLLAAPIRRHSIILGKGITSMVLGVVSMTVLVISSSFLLGAEWGDPLGVALLVLAAVFAAMGLMAVVAGFARTPEGAGNLQSIIAVLLGMLGGAFFPISRAGGLLSTVSFATPHAWFLRGLGELSAGGGLEAALPAVGAIASFGLVTLTLAQVRMGSVLAR
jgi:ABC-2 type transport system permease protein